MMFQTFLLECKHHCTTQHLQLQAVHLTNAMASTCRPTMGAQAAAAGHLLLLLLLPLLLLRQTPCPHSLTALLPPRSRQHPPSDCCSLRLSRKWLSLPCRHCRLSKVQSIPMPLSFVQQTGTSCSLASPPCQQVLPHRSLECYYTRQQC